jgi:hypothetical protein
MIRSVGAALIASLWLAAVAPPGAAQVPAPATAAAPADMPPWMRRGLPAAGHATLAPLVGKWRVRLSIRATFGRSPDAPPIISEDLVCERVWVAGGRYLEDVTTGTAAGGAYWRKGWLGYSTMDNRYEWVTIDGVNSMMMSYAGKPGTGSARPISMSGVFTDQGVAGEASVGRSVRMRTTILIEGPDRHVFELYFTPPGKPEVLAQCAVYTRVAVP